MTDQHERIRAAFRLNLEQQKKQAKGLLKAVKAGDVSALARISCIDPATSNKTSDDLKLSDAQFVIARELRMSSWPELKAHIETLDRARASVERKAEAPDRGMKTLHLRCGSDIRSTLLEAGFQGDFLEHSYPYCHAPVTATEDHFEREAKYLAELAGKFMNVTFDGALSRRHEEERSLAGSAERYERIVLWMEHDCFDQLVLVRCLAQYAIKGPSVLEVIDVDHFPGTIRFIGLGQLPVEALRMLWESRKPVTQAALQLAGDVWAALRMSDPRPLATLMRAGCAALPNLQFALHRLLQELPSTLNGMSLTERLTLELLCKQCATLNNLFAMLTYDVDPLPFATDLKFVQTIERLQELSSTIVTRAAGKNLWNDELTITDAGRRLVAGDIDLMSLQPDPRWVGGVEIHGGGAVWRWDEPSRIPVLR
jgi:hypothetical protein